ncbi:MAG: restriction endonuclease subunit S [Treponema sp.]|nr:restriction endonuclease subunit S [Treponema sp.]MBR5645875.1 restriction endonuclease subunit S [Treponema sp.]
MREGWKKVTLGEISFITDGDHLPPPKTECGIPFIFISNIEGFNKINFTNCSYVPESYYEKIIDKRKVKENDILYTVVGSYGIPVLIKNVKKFCFQRHIALIRAEKVSPDFLVQALDSSDFHSQADKVAIGEAQKTVTLDNLRKLRITLPPIVDQEKIAETLSIWDSAIKKTEKLISEKEKNFDFALKKNLISGSTTKVLFSDLFIQSNEKNSSNILYPALSVTKDGVVFQEEYFNKRVANEDTSNYLIARRNTFVFSGLNFWMGSVDLQTLTDIGIISPAYKVFTINTDLISYKYAHFLIRSKYMKRLLMDSSIVGASIVRRNLDMDNLLNSVIELPELKQQEIIAERLSLIQKDIELNKKLLEQYKLQKQGLMQKLLTGEWRMEGEIKND